MDTVRAYPRNSPQSRDCTSQGYSEWITNRILCGVESPQGDWQDPRPPSESAGAAEGHGSLLTRDSNCIASVTVTHRYECKERLQVVTGVPNSRSSRSCIEGGNVEMPHEFDRVLTGSGGLYIISDPLW